MACNASKTPFIRIVSKRGFAAQACPSVAPKAEVSTTTLPNKLVVATAESALPVSRVSIVFRAGSRNEKYENLGASHYLRIAAGLSTNNATAFGITRNIQQVGGNLTVTSDRETIAYTVETTSDNLETGLRFLQDAVTAPAFKPWELSDSVPRLKIQVANVPAQVRAVELLHKAAFRTALGNSIYCPKRQVGKLSTETLLHYFNSNCTTNRAAVVAVGVDHNTLKGYAQSLELESGAGSENAAKYNGGEIRKEKNGNLAHVAVAAEGASLANIKEALAFAILQQALGVSANTKRGVGNGSLHKAVNAVVADNAVSVSALNASYKDSGLLGFVLSTDGKNAGKAVEAAVKALKAGVSSADVNRGKAQLKAAIVENQNSGRSLLADIGAQAVLLGEVHNADALSAAIDGVSDADVKAAARKVAGSKLSIGAVGNLANVPYVSDLA